MSSRLGNAACSAGRPAFRSLLAKACQPNRRNSIKDSRRDAACRVSVSGGRRGKPRLYSWKSETENSLPPNERHYPSGHKDSADEQGEAVEAVLQLLHCGVAVFDSEQGRRE